ncbi:MAG TPA: hypothetical protein PLZ57_06590 [Pseudobdellovibrionaceae bacterium]|nr:hypothetical protein [Pseudobdellovibrionaceae bacterium]
MAFFPEASIALPLPAGTFAGVLPVGFVALAALAFGLPFAGLAFVAALGLADALALAGLDLADALTGFALTALPLDVALDLPDLLDDDDLLALLIGTENLSPLELCQKLFAAQRTKLTRRLI